MELEKILGIEHLAYQDEDGEQKIYILPDTEDVEQLMDRLREGGLSDTLQISLSPKSGAGQESKQRETLLYDMATRIQAIADTPADRPLPQPIDEVEQLLDEYLAIDGEQKMYILPDDLDVDQILGSLTGVRTGEIKQSQMWRKTDIKSDSQGKRDIMVEVDARFQVMDKRIERLEYLLNQIAGHDITAIDKKIE